MHTLKQRNLKFRIATNDKLHKGTTHGWCMCVCEIEGERRVFTHRVLDIWTIYTKNPMVVLPFTG